MIHSDNFQWCMGMLFAQPHVRYLIRESEDHMFNGLCHIGNFGAIGALGTWGWVSAILHLVFWVGLIVGIVLLLVWIARQSGSNRVLASISTQEILQMRYARGEITREQYQQMLGDIR
jgi:putative membrane protein